MNRKYYFIAGLPRSGSTVLSAILNQNSEFYSGPSSPVFSSMFVLEQHMMGDELFNAYPKEEGRLMVSSLIDNYYNDVKNSVVFDKNRSWPMHISYIKHYITDDVKIICPVRDIEEVLASFITMIRRNPYVEGNPRINFVDEQLIKNNIPISDVNRCEYLMTNGIVKESCDAMHDAITKGNSNLLHFVEYQNLVNDPINTMKEIYNFLGEDYYEHTFDNLTNKNREKDFEAYGIADMHEIRKSLEDTSENPKNILPEEVIEKCKGSDFWRRSNSFN
jgi:sulfotransferase